MYLFETQFKWIMIFYVEVYKHNVQLSENLQNIVLHNIYYKYISITEN